MIYRIKDELHWTTKEDINIILAIAKIANLKFKLTPLLPANPEFYFNNSVKRVSFLIPDNKESLNLLFKYLGLHNGTDIK